MKVSYLIDEENPPSILNRRVPEIGGALNHAYMTAIELNKEKRLYSGLNLQKIVISELPKIDF